MIFSMARSKLVSSVSKNLYNHLSLSFQCLQHMSQPISSKIVVIPLSHILAFPDSGDCKGQVSFTAFPDLFPLPTSLPWRGQCGMTGIPSEASKIAWDLGLGLGGLLLRVLCGGLCARAVHKRQRKRMGGQVSLQTSACACTWPTYA